MPTQQEVFDRVKQTLVELFEVDAAKIVPGARLYDDLDIDSIDAIDLILELKDLTGKRVDPEQFKHVRSIDDLVAVVHDLLREKPAA
jgi:acyl carrier protein